MIDYIALGVAGVLAYLLARHLLRQADHREDKSMSQDWLERQRKTEQRAKDWRDAQDRFRGENGG